MEFNHFYKMLTKNNPFMKHEQAAVDYHLLPMITDAAQYSPVLHWRCIYLLSALSIRFSILFKIRENFPTLGGPIS